jgi:uncharacterized protein
LELTESFTVPTTIDRLWELLTDVERVAPCVPGFTLNESKHPDYRGLMKVKVGAITIQYDATITFVERDDVARKVVLAVRGKELRGAGSVDATVTAELIDHGTQTAAQMVTDVQVTGRIAQFGRGIIADVSSRMTEQFVERLNQLLERPAESTEPAASGGPGRAGFADDAPLNLAAVAAVPVLKRIVPIALILALAVIVARLLGRRSR